MSVQAKKRADFLHGKLLKKMLLFSVPMILSAMLQLLFNAADVAIVGKFGGTIYQSAVGATSSTIHLIVNLLIGISVGANVAMATALGAKDEKKQSRVTHSAMSLAAVGGLLVAVVGITLARPIMTIMKTPSDIIDYSVLYMQVYFIGAPANIAYPPAASLFSPAFRALGSKPGTKVTARGSLIMGWFPCAAAVLGSPNPQGKPHIT